MEKIRTLKSRDSLVDFVRYYKLLPVLWNTKCHDYHNRDIRMKAYLLLLRKYRESEPSATLHDVKAKLNTLRSNYRRYLKKVGSTEVQSSFRWWNELHFINGKEEVESEIDVDASYEELKNDPLFDEEAELTGHLDESKSELKYQTLGSNQKLGTEMTGRKMWKTKTLQSRDSLVDFIRYYKLLPVLWNTKCHDYHNRDIRLKAYLLLLRQYRESEPSATLHDVKAKLNTLRSNYRRYLKKVGSTEVQSSFRWWNEMHFINGKEEVESEIDVDASYEELKNDPLFDEEAELTGHLDESKSELKYQTLGSNQKLGTEMTGRKMWKTKTLQSRDSLVDFIRYYKLLPVLWNTKCHDYHNRDIRLKAYLLLLRQYRESEPSATLHDVKAKLNTLRSNYRRYLKKVGSTEVQSSFRWWNEMHFINGKEEVESEIDVDASYEELKNDPLFDEEALVRPPQHSDELESDTTYNEWESMSKRTLTKVYTRIKQDTAPRLIYENELHNEDMSCREDEYYCWAKVMVSELKKMSPIQQIYAKKAITEILMEGQLGLLHKDSVQINKTNQHCVCKNEKTENTKTSDDQSTNRKNVTPDTMDELGDSGPMMLIPIKTDEESSEGGG